MLVGTPIGNLGDLSQRSVAVLGAADLVCCEDTRRTRALLAHLGLRGKRLLAVHRDNERQQLPAILACLAAGSTVALVTDAGMPGLSDPGTAVVGAAIAARARVTVVPGPDAATTALVLSGLPTDRWCFEGFLPRRGPARRQRLAALAVEERTTVVFEAPSRLPGTLADVAAACGAERHVAVARELTKAHEEVWRGPVGEGAAVFADRQHTEGIRGEIVLVVGPASPPSSDPGDDEVAAAVARHRARGVSVRDAAALAAQELGVARRRAYGLAVARRDQPAGAESGSDAGGGPGVGVGPGCRDARPAGGRAGQREA